MATSGFQRQGRRLQGMLPGSNRAEVGRETLMNSKITLAYRAVLIAATLSVTACSPDNAAGGGAGNAAKVMPNNAGAAAEQAAPEEAANLTGPQKNAVRSAKQYLSLSGFSREGLIQQLSSSAGDGYDVADATAAVNRLEVDWNENAAKSAKQYLSLSGFSCKRLIEQLSSSAGDKYTVSQATYGAQQEGACS